MSKATYFFRSSPRARDHPLEGKFASVSPDAQGSPRDATPLENLGGLYWFVEMPGEHKTLSTEEIAEVMDVGRRVRAISGPFPTRDDAERSLERYWEMMMSDDGD
jgi:hypothetical protein